MENLICQQEASSIVIPSARLLSPACTLPSYTMWGGAGTGVVAAFKNLAEGMIIQLDCQPIFDNHPDWVPSPLLWFLSIPGLSLGLQHMHYEILNGSHCNW